MHAMKKAFTSVALIGKYMNPEMREHILTLADFLGKKGLQVLIEGNTSAQSKIEGYDTVALNDIGTKADLAVVLGGDGTMLSVARAVMAHKIPLVGINRGRFGFLTDINSSSMCENMSGILDGEYDLEKRILLSATVKRDGEVVTSGCALNDVVINKNGMARLIELEVHIDHQFVHRQRSDGLILATPTGTTAYSLSAGGPILHPTLDAIALVPICPHTLSNRPIAINSSSCVEITVIHAMEARMHLDGQLQFELLAGDKVHVQRADKTVTLLHPKGHSHYDMLREKLNWG